MPDRHPYWTEWKKFLTLDQPPSGHMNENYCQLWSDLDNTA